MQKRIQVVEDDEDIRFIIEFILKDADYDVTVSPNATHFKETTSEYKPDLILLDIMLPDGDGRDICKNLKSDKQTQNIPVVLMSAHAGEEGILETTKADYFLKKPFDIDHFLERVYYFLNK